MGCRNLRVVEGHGLDNPMPTVPQVVIAGSPHQSDHLPFDWGVYQDPARPEFWADGAYGILPRPFLHLAGEPTRENARQLLAWQKQQWQTIEQIIKALGGANELDTYSNLIGENVLEHIAQQDKLLLQTATPLLRESKQDIPPGFDWANVAIVYIYRSDCPACRKQQHVIETIKALGAKVATLQLDRGAPLHTDSRPYHAGEWSLFFPLGKAQTTPMFYIARRGQKPFKHEGFIALQDLITHIKRHGGET